MTGCASFAGFRLREPILAFAAAAAALLAAGPVAAQAPPLEEAAGRLLAAPAPLDVGGETIGSFQLEAAASGQDLRAAPGSAVLEMFDGRIAGAAVRANEVRNVDPLTGRPRGAGETGPCTGGAEPACLTPGGATDQNLQAFADICSFTQGFTALDPTSCALDIYNSQFNILSGTLAMNPVAEATLASFLSNLLAGTPNAGAIGAALAGPQFPPTLVPLNADACDGFLADCVTTAQGTSAGGTIPEVDTPNNVFNAGGTPTLNLLLTQQQKALLGCGEFFDQNCEIDGIRLDQAEAGALVGSFVFGDGDTFADVSQPGTVGFVPLREPLATRTVASGVVILPGARGANASPTTNLADDPGYNPGLDGCSAPGALGCNLGDALALPDGTPATRTTGTASFLQHPFAGSGPDRTIGTPDDIPSQYQYFASETAALSWNFLMTLVGFSLPNADSVIEANEFDQTNPFRTDGCSFARPGLCNAVIALELLATTEREDDPSGAPRLRWVWETGAEYAIDEATGAVSPWLGGRLHAAGPEVARLPGEPTGAGFFAALPDDFDPMEQTLPSALFVARSAGVDQVLGTADDGILGLSYGVAVACGNGEDDDGDGLYDRDDPGCPSALAEPEDPSCDDGEDNDENGLTDFDDPKCTPEFPYGERAPCGLGAELALLLLPWLWRARRRSRGAGQPVA